MEANVQGLLLHHHGHRMSILVKKNLVRQGGPDEKRQSLTDKEPAQEAANIERPILLLLLSARVQQ